MTFNCMIVDDDEMSRLVVKQFIDKTFFLTLAYDIDNTKGASEILLGESANEVDIIFLAIDMFGIKDLVKSLSRVDSIVMITSKKDYAIEAFGGEVADYLVKPVKYERFIKAVSKVKERLEKGKLFAESEDHIYVKSDGKLFRLSYDKILFVEALADYVIFNTPTSKHIVHHTMKGIEKSLPESIFSRVHRSYIINRNMIHKIEDLQVFIGEKTLSIGASYKDSLMEKFNLL